MTERVKKTEEFLRQKLAESTFFVKNPEKGDYRLEHSIRVARIAAEIARDEGMDVEAMTIAGLLHDVSYCREFAGHDDWKNHGRDAARIARPFLETLDLPGQVVEDICYGIAIHVDDKADFPGKRTAFALTVMDADNIDRFDVCRLYETLENVKFSKFSPAEKAAYVAQIEERLTKYLDLPLATAAATKLWRERIGFYLDFYRRLREQLKASAGYLDDRTDSGNIKLEINDRMMELSGRF